MKIIEIPCLPQAIDPKLREERYRVAFAAEAVVMVREILAVGGKDNKRTKIVFRGDNYEHHALETDIGYDDIRALIGGNSEQGGTGP